MLGIIDVGGGTRDIYGAGVLDHLMDECIKADLFIGVSAGSANGASYLAGQRGRNYRFYNKYVFRHEYMSVRNFFLKGSYIDLEYIYGTLSKSDGEDPFDYEAFISNPAEYVVVATDAFTGKPTYFNKDDMSLDHYETLMTSSCVPAINKPYVYKGKPYFDGGVSDPIPFDKAFEMGCDKLIIILTRPRTALRKPKSDFGISHVLEIDYPVMADAMRKRCDVYNEELMRALRYEKEGKLLIVAPDDIKDMKTLTKDLMQLNRMYRMGYNDAEAVFEYLK